MKKENVATINVTVTKGKERTSIQCESCGQIGLLNKGIASVIKGEVTDILKAENKDWLKNPDKVMENIDRICDMIKHDTLKMFADEAIKGFMKSMLDDDEDEDEDDD